MIIVKLCGGDVIGVENDSEIEVEVRQYHRDFLGDGVRIEDASGFYQPIWPSRLDENGDDPELLDRVYGKVREHPCVHGHYDCATLRGGPCADETYARLFAEKHG